MDESRAESAPIRTRYAPSPTGALHLGHARTHLAAYLLARSRRGRIVMRFEDLDRPRVRAGSIESILADHAFLGLDFDEGPYFQSERLPLYEESVERLRTSGAIYPCTCSRKEIEAVASAPHGDEGALYPGTCRDGPTHPERPAAWRFRMPEPPPAFVDLLAGPSNPGLGRGDFVVQRADGVFAYQLAVVVDDDAMGITHVVRGEDLLASTPRQLALFAALSRPAPSYLHLPLVRGEDGERLAKRNGAVGIGEYREAGISRERLLGVLGHSLGLLDAPEPCDLDELRARFRIDALARMHEPARAAGLAVLRTSR